MASLPENSEALLGRPYGGAGPGYATLLDPTHAYIKFMNRASVYHSTFLSSALRQALTSQVLLGLP